MSEEREQYEAKPNVEIDDLDVCLGELHNSTHAWFFAAGRDRTLEHAEMLKAEAAVRAIVGRLRLEVRQLKAAAEHPVSAIDLASALRLNPFCDLVGQCEVMRLEIDELRVAHRNAERHLSDLALTLAGAISALRLDPRSDILIQCERLNDELDELRTGRASLRADIERIGHERDQMVAANTELQDRLSRLEDDGK